MTTPETADQTVRYEVDSAVLGHVMSECATLAKDDDLVDVPTETQLRLLIADTFWASLHRDETRSVLPRAGFFRPSSSTEYQFATRVPLSSRGLAQLALTLSTFDAVGVCAHDGGDHLSAWGVGLPTFGAIVVGALSPGVLVVSAGHPIAVLHHESAHIIDRGAIERARALLSGVEVPGEIGDRRARHVLLRVGRAVARLGHGGSIVVVPSGSRDWRDYIEQNTRDTDSPWQLLPTALAQSYSARQQREAAQRGSARAPRFSAGSSVWSAEEAQARVQQSIDRVALLTSIDGAVVVDSELRVLSFGAKLAAPSSINKVRVVRPLHGSKVSCVSIDEIGGMRHQSAAKFVAAVGDASAIVVSQDGPISVLGREDGRVTQLRDIELLRV